MFLPQIGKVVEIFYQCVQGIVSNQNDSSKAEHYHIEAQKLIDSNKIKSMLSILNTYILSNQDQKTSQEKDFYVNLFKMLCEIIKEYKDTYVAQHCVQTLASLLKTENQNKSTFYKEYLPQVKTLLHEKSQVWGLNDSASIFVGHAILNLLQLEMTDDSSTEDLLLNCMVRMSQDGAL